MWAVSSTANGESEAVIGIFSASRFSTAVHRLAYETVSPPQHVLHYAPSTLTLGEWPQTPGRLDGVSLNTMPVFHAQIDNYCL